MAGRIPQAFIDDLLARLDIIDIVDSRIKLKKTGRNYSACCPFHKEKTPSFTVSADKQFYYCFGCGASGNALGFIMTHDHLDFPAAVELLAGQLGLEVPREHDNGRPATPDYSPLYQLTEQATRFFQQQLQDSSRSAQAHHYLQGRGLDEHSIQQFNIGFAPAGWDHLGKHLNHSPELEKQLIKVGLLVENEDNRRIYDRFRNRIIFPIRDARGRFIAFGGRVLGDEKPKYLNSPESPIFQKGRELYGLYEARQANRSLKNLIVVEGYMDVVALAQQGISNSVATLGTATTAEHMQRLFKVAPEVIFCFDGDDAGRRAGWRALESTLPEMEDGRQARFLFLPQGEDPDSLVRKEGAEAFRNRLHSQALSLDTLLFRELEQGLDLTTMDGAARLAKLAQPYLGKLPEGIFKQLVLQKLAGLTGLDSQQLSNQLLTQKKSPNQTTTDWPAQPEHPPEPTPWIRESGTYQPSPAVQRKPVSKISSSGYAIRQLLCNPQLAQGIDNLDSLASHPSADTRLLIRLIKTLQQSPGLSAIALIAQEHNTPAGQRLQELATFDLGAEVSDREFHETLAHIRAQTRKNQHTTQLNSLKNTLAHASPSQMSPEQRQELLEWLAQKQQILGKNKGNTEKK